MPIWLLSLGKSLLFSRTFWTITVLLVTHAYAFHQGGEQEKSALIRQHQKALAEAQKQAKDEVFKIEAAAQARELQAEKEIEALQFDLSLSQKAIAQAEGMKTECKISEETIKQFNR